MNKFLWKILVVFFNFQNVISIKIIKNRIVVDYLVIILNAFSATTFQISIGLVIITGNVANVLRDDAFQVTMPSLLYTRIIRLFPILSIGCFYVAMFLLLKQKKIIKISRRIFHLIQLTEFDVNSLEFKNYEILCCLILLVHQIFIIMGIVINNLYVARPNLISIIFAFGLIWNLFVFNYFMLAYIMVLYFLSTIMDKIYNDLKNGSITCDAALVRLKYVGSVIELINRTFKWQISMGYLLSVLLIWIRVNSYLYHEELQKHSYYFYF